MRGALLYRHCQKLDLQKPCVNGSHQSVTRTLLQRALNATSRPLTGEAGIPEPRRNSADTWMASAAPR